MFVLFPLRRRPIALLWTGQVLSAIGDEVYKVALILIAVNLMGKDAGLVAALQAGAVLVAGLVGGVIADGWAPRATMVGVDVARALLVCLPPLWVLFHPLTLPVLLPVVLVVSALSAFFDPALQEMLPELAGEPRLLGATNALLDATRRLARILGPALVGMTAAFLPTVQLFAVDAMSFVCSALSVSLVKLPRYPGKLPGETRATPREEARDWKSALGAIVRGLGSGVPLLRSDPLLSAAFGGAVLVWSAWSIAYFLALPLWLHEKGLSGGHVYGLILSAYGLGNLTSNLVFGSLSPRRLSVTLFLGTGIVGAGIVLVGLSPAAAWMVPAAALSAVGGPMEDLSLLRILQSRYQGRDIARLYRLLMTMTNAGLLAAYLASPLLFRWFPPRSVILAAGSVMMAWAAFGVWHFADAAYGRGIGVGT